MSKFSMIRRVEFVQIKIAVSFTSATRQEYGYFILQINQEYDD
ncbi:hypothetical protein [Paenibacillus pabuli]|nr:hypothetical protein [Paenibacillus pabuli]MEC0128275.1 hypothetical protein [Paenibacillus pabuli]